MNRREMIRRVREINARFEELASLCEAERRSLTADEQDERTALTGEKNVLELRLLRGENPAQPQEENRGAAFAECVRALRRNAVPEGYDSLVHDGSLLVPVTRAEVQDSGTAGPVIPLTVGDIIQPLEKGLILDLVGCRLQNGIAGSWQFPVVAGGVEAELAEENVELTDKTIDITKISPSPKRVGISIPVSNRAIDQSSGVILDIVRTQLTMGLSRLLNRWMFSETKIVDKASDGCFVAAAAAPAVEFAGNVPTWGEVLQVESAVLETGIVPDGSTAWVCSASMFAKLKAAPKDAGSGRFIVENGTIDGYPVYVTEYVPRDFLGFGVFAYELVGQFGEMRMTVDNSSAAVAKKNLTYFVFNSDFDMLTLRKEAFAAGKVKAAGA